ncbi:AMP-binding enzyme [Nonomuraea insulae]|uniref:AMP-binding enzyme C-terminal domain-containing protein n=1 Tax=Nonomuraea insulae TaxID=1616787 RepID=A0ABW1D507_9ACTN
MSPEDLDLVELHECFVTAELVHSVRAGRGRRGRQVVAVVQLADGNHDSEQVSGELDAHCRSSLTRAKCPRRYEFVETLPRTETGKLLRRVIRETLRSSSGRDDGA